MLPRDGLLDKVKRMADLNTLMQKWIFQWFLPGEAEPVSAAPNIQQAAKADTLYDLLRARPSCKDESEHTALLQLSEWDNAQDGDTVFRLFLSNCSAMEKWHKTTCAFER